MQQPGERQLILVFLFNLLFFPNDAEHQSGSTQRAIPSLENTEKKMGRVVAQGRETQLVPERHTKIT